MKMMRTVLLTVVLGSCTCTPDVQKEAQVAKHAAAVARLAESVKAAAKATAISTKPAVTLKAEAKPKAAETASAEKVVTSVVPKPAAHTNEAAKPKAAATAPAAKAAAGGVSKPATHTNVAAKPKAAETASAKKVIASVVPKPASKQPTHTNVAAKPKAAKKVPAEKAAASHVSKPASHSNAAAKPKAAVTVPVEKVATKKAAEKIQPHLLPHTTVSKKSPSELPVVRVVATDAVAQPAVHAHVQVAASAPAASPAAAPAGADWRKEYKHADDTSQLKWKWTTNKPGTYDISKKAPPKFLPIGEGAYQSAKAVAQRTTDKTKDCEEGKWNDCFLKAGNDLTDGHNYKHLEGKFGNTPASPRSGAGATKLGLAIVSMLFTILMC